MELKIYMTPVTFILDTDASHHGIGAVLSQRQPDDPEKVLYYASNKYTKSENNYFTTRRELSLIHI